MFSRMPSILIKQMLYVIYNITTSQPGFLYKSSAHVLQMLLPSEDKPNPPAKWYSPPHVLCWKGLH